MKCWLSKRQLIALTSVLTSPADLTPAGSQGRACGLSAAPPQGLWFIYRPLNSPIHSALVAHRLGELEPHMGPSHHPGILSMLPPARKHFYP